MTPKYIGALVGISLALLIALWPATPDAQGGPSASTAIHTLLKAQSADETVGAAVEPSELRGCREVAIYAEWATGVTSGVVQIETALTEDYGGTWAPLYTLTFSGTAPKADIIQITGVHRYLRSRISTVVANGTVTTQLICT